MLLRPWNAWRVNAKKKLAHYLSHVSGRYNPYDSAPVKREEREA